MASKQRIAFLQDGAHFAKKLIAGGAVEIADGAAEEKHEQAFAFAAALGHFLQSLEIGALESDQADHVHLAEFLLAAEERAAGNVDGVVIHALPARERFEQPAGFLPAAAAEFGDNHRTRNTVDDFA